MADKAKEVEEGKIVVILAYLIWIVGIIWFFADEKMRKNEFVKFHIKQVLILVIASVIVSIVGSIIPFIGWFIILPLGSLFIFVLWIIGLINAIGGKEKELWLIGGFAKHLNF